MGETKMSNSGGGEACFCGKKAEKHCTGCHAVVYCTKEHQKQDWKTHKANCLPYKVVETPDKGRYAAAARI